MQKLNDYAYENDEEAY